MVPDLQVSYIGDISMKRQKKARRPRPTKTSTFTMRMRPELKDIIDEAAAREGISMAKFMELAAIERATRPPQK